MYRQEINKALRKTSLTYTTKLKYKPYLNK